jgi:uncharacterized protein
MSDEESLLEFPCEFPVKAFGTDTGDFDDVVVALVREHAPGISIEKVYSRSSRGGRYLAVTVNVWAESRDQLDAIYYALSADERVLMAL